MRRSSSLIATTALVFAVIVAVAAECEDTECGRCCCDNGTMTSIVNDYGETIHGRAPMVRESGNIRGSQCLADAIDFPDADGIGIVRGQEVAAGEYSCYRFVNKIREAAYMNQGKLEVMIKPCSGKPLLLASVYECPTLKNSKTVWKYGKNYYRKASETVQEWEDRLDKGDAKEEWEWKGDEQKLIIPITHATFYISVFGDDNITAEYSISARAYDQANGQPPTFDTVPLSDKTVDYVGGNETRGEWVNANDTAVCTATDATKCLGGSDVKVFWTPPNGLLPGRNDSNIVCHNETIVGCTVTNTTDCLNQVCVDKIEEARRYEYMVLFRDITDIVQENFVGQFQDNRLLNANKGTLTWFKNSVECLKHPPDCCSETLPNDGDGFYPYYCKPGLRLADGERWSRPLNGTTCRELLSGTTEEECGMLTEFYNVTMAMMQPPWLLRPTAKDARLHNMWTVCGAGKFGTPIPRGNSSEDWSEPIDGYSGREDLLMNTGKSYSDSDWKTFDDLERDTVGHLGLKVYGFQEEVCNTTGRCWTNQANNTYIVNVLVKDTQTGYVGTYKFTTVQVKAPVYGKISNRAPFYFSSSPPPTPYAPPTAVIFFCLLFFFLPCSLSVTHTTDCIL
mmetsp:Transcript_17980/g.44585  ORF Transcript_17980/g.44585 Transcript_17980/m.44585 type:complete len:622 (-) Transcript_17980:648-2513(-)